MTLLEVTPDETPAAIPFIIYIIIESCFALSISILISYIISTKPTKALIILIAFIGVITLPALFANE